MQAESAGRWEGKRKSAMSAKPGSAQGQRVQADVGLGERSQGCTQWAPTWGTQLPRMPGPQPCVCSDLISEISSTYPSSVITADINLIILAWCGMGLLCVLLIFNFRETSAGGESTE